jgi:hypothetical protein
MTTAIYRNPPALRQSRVGSAALAAATLALEMLYIRAQAR